MAEDAIDGESGTTDPELTDPEMRIARSRNDVSLSRAIKRSRELIEESRRILAESRRTAPPRD